VCGPRHDGRRGGCGGQPGGRRGRRDARAGRGRRRRRRRRGEQWRRTRRARDRDVPALPSPHEFSEVSALRDIHFDFDRTALRPEDGRILDGNARWLLAHPGTQVLIEGHADERGTNEYNLSLGETRARVTRDQLVARGVVASRITILSYGEERPSCSDPSESCWQKNRRAHFLVKSAVTVSDARK
jgi:peptidoglycan-associated lipoprotein